ncbi:hypothetical protein EMCRGX_G000258 [Ephydatia muelleri]
MSQNRVVVENKSVGIDFIGPLPTTSKGNKYVVTLVDFFSKWPEAAPLTDKTAASVALFLFETFCRKPKLPIDMEYAMSSTGNGDGARNDESDGDVHTDGDGAPNAESDGDVHTGDGDRARNDESDGDVHTGDKSSQRNVIKSQKQCPYWIKDLSLNYKHKTIIETNEMLTDEHIQAAQNLLKKQFQHLAGLQSTLLFQNKGFSPALISDGSFQEVVQVLFVPERDHWVTTSYHEGEVRLYDSKFNHVLSDSLKEQINIIYKEATQSNVLTVRAMPVQQQTGGVDCGLIAIAFAYHAALGKI